MRFVAADVAHTGGAYPGYNLIARLGVYTTQSTVLRPITRNIPISLMHSSRADNQRKHIYTPQISDPLASDLIWFL